MKYGKGGKTGKVSGRPKPKKTSKKMSGRVGSGTKLRPQSK